jgi:two-component system response regulator MprA
VRSVERLHVRGALDGEDPVGVQAVRREPGRLAPYRLPEEDLMTHSPAPAPATAARLLVVDDDRAIRESLERVLTLEGHRVIAVADGAAALEAARNEQVDLIVLDLMLPSVDGLTVCRVLRSEDDRTPILILTARTETSDRVVGLDAGADDYLPKPFDPAELLARVRALLRRTRVGQGASLPAAPLQVADLRLDPSARRAWRADQELELSKTEFDLLELLMFNAGIVLDRSRIYEEIWGYDFGPDSKNLAVYISYIRRKVDDGHDVKLIHTVRGVGYTLRED